MPFTAAWDRAVPFASFVASAEKLRELWHAQWARATVPPAFVARAAAIGGSWRLLVLSEDWCGDAVNSLPIIARLAADVPSLELRVLPRDANLDVMDRFLTNGRRSIPKLLVLDAAGAVRGTWGPRPAPLHSWVLAEGLDLPKDERYRHIRTWYARDKGRTTLDEVIEVVASAARSAP